MYQRIRIIIPSHDFIFSFKPKFIHAITNSKPFCQNTKTPLATHLGSILEAFSDYPFALQRANKQVHAQFIVNKISTNASLGAKILGMYVLCGSFVDAINLFYCLELTTSLPWNRMIRVLVQMGWFDFAFLFYFKMLSFGVVPDNHTFPSVIKACGSLDDVRLGRIVHETIRELGCEFDVFVGSSLVKFYAEKGCIDEARCLFDEMSERDCVLWNVMLNGYVKSGELGNAIKLFKEMRRSEIKPNSVTFACVLSICAVEGMIEFGMQLHGFAVGCGLEFDSPVSNSLLTMYSKCEQLSDACKLFELMPLIDLVTWNGMIAGHVQNGFMGEALDLFSKMISSGVKPDPITFSSFLPSVAELASLKQGKEIHGYIIRNGVPLDAFLKSALIDLYLKCRDVKMACKIFNLSSTSDVAMCTAMISGFVLNGMNSDALKKFRFLIHENMTPNAVTLASILPAIAGLAALKLGKELHGNVLKNGLDRKCQVGSAIANMYAKCGRLDLAHKIFGGMLEKDVICWNSMITSCSQNGRPEEAIDLFRQMGLEGMKYDHVSISAALSACANLPALHFGKEIHGFMIKGSCRFDLFAEGALIDMYAKCGKLDFSRAVFDMMGGKNEVAWNSIIAAYGSHGHLKESLALFHEMLENKIQPDHVTFLAIISACAHAGQVDDGIHYFHCMTQEYGIPAHLEHYACMVDLFGRAGRLDKAFETINSMPFSPDAGVWGTLLGACRVHGNVELAEFASKHLFDLDPQNSGYYVLLSNIHADAGQWGNVLKIRCMMKERGVEKVPGYSWIEVNNTTYMFVAADESHPESAQIYKLLKSLLIELRKEGYVPQPYLPMHPQTLKL
ncbi:pentatricopeptide repeat-containing protein At4g21300-like [Mangifera indica]|uniref:pentatricopeptide repeat-containing protein At4g21300-like n=1 Tax=Mangifera indica TaxID=29780 RepID=UPI001CF96AC6|nr:pentatricopeptide repeat-containing protein At4g21300-like [Mangifera indica]